MKRRIIVSFMIAFVIVLSLTTKSESNNEKVLVSKVETHDIDRLLKSQASFSEENLPSSYDLRNVDGKNYAPTVKNQGRYGICWDFGLVSAMESSIVKSGLVNSNEDISISTRYFDFASSNSLIETYNPYTTRVLGDGTVSHTILDYLLISGMGPVEKKNIDDGIVGTWEGYTEGVDFTTDQKIPLKSVLDNHLSSYTVTDTMINSIGFYPTDEEKEKFINDVKNHIKNYGALSATLLGPSGGYKCVIFSDNNDFYIDASFDGCEYNHEMTLIGWDDNYEASYCDSYHEDGNKIPKYGFDKNKCLSDGYEWITRKGAWIVQNSWGNNNRTYGHASYDSKFSVYGITGIVKKDWNNNYNTITSSYKESVNDTNDKIFKFSKIDNLEESIIRLSFIKSNCDSKVNVYLSKNCTSDCNDYTRIGAINEGNGIESIEIDRELINSNYFSIKVSNSCIVQTGVYTNKDETTNPSSKIIIDGLDSFDTKIELIANNLEPGTKIIYKLYDKNSYIAGEPEISTIYGYIINNVSKVDLVVPRAIGKGQYVIAAYQDNTEIASSDFYYNGKGLGDEKNPFLISKREELEKICDSQKSRKSHYRLDNDLYLPDWETICGTGPLSFQGTLDGAGHVIYNLGVSEYGLFYQTEGSSIKNITFKNININSSNGGTGIITHAAYDTSFEQISITGTITKRSYDTIGLTFLGTTSSINNVFINVEYNNEQDDFGVFVNYSHNTNVENSYAIVKYENKNKSFIVDNNQIYSYTLEKLKNKSTYVPYGFDFDNVWEIEEDSFARLKIMPDSQDEYVYTITFDANRGNGFGAGSMPSMKLTPYGYVTIPENKYTNDGYKFLFWTTNQDGSGDKYYSGQRIDLPEIDKDTEVTLYAQWEAVELRYKIIDFSIERELLDLSTNKYLYTFNMSVEYSGNPHIIDSELYYYKTGNDSPVLLKYMSCSIRDNEISYSTKVEIIDTEWELFMLNLMDEQKIYYSIDRDYEYTISFDANGGKGTMNSMNLVGNSKGIIPNNKYVKKGYEFTYWTTNKDGSGDIYYPGQAFSALHKNTTSEVTLYAQWKESEEVNEIKNYTVDSNNYVNGISLNTKVSDYLKNYNYSDKYEIVVYNNKTVLGENDLVGTGSVTKVYENGVLVESFRNIIMGDITGTGNSTISDVAKLYQFYKNKITMEEWFIKAGKVVGNDTIGINDVAKLYQFARGKIPNL